MGRMSVILLVICLGDFAYGEFTRCRFLFEREDILEKGRELFAPLDEIIREKFESNTPEFLNSERIPAIRKNLEASGGSTEIFHREASNGERYLHLGANPKLTNGERFHPDAAAIFVVMPGQGGIYSTINSNIPFVSAINSRSLKNKSPHSRFREKTNKDGERIAGRFEKDPNDPGQKIPVYAEPLFKDAEGRDIYAVDPKTGEPLIYFHASAEAVELPGRTGSKNAWELMDYREFVEYMTPYFVDLKAAAGDRPIFVVGRSASGMYSITFQQMMNQAVGYELISASVAISPMYPSIQTLPHNKYSTYVADKELYKKHGPEIINEELYRWTFAMHEQMDALGLRERLHDPKDPARFLIMSSQKDPEVVDIERFHYEQIGASSPNRRYVMFPEKADHDILQSSDKDLRLRALHELYSFLRPIVNNPN